MLAHQRVFPLHEGFYLPRKDRFPGPRLGPWRPRGQHQLGGAQDLVQGRGIAGKNQWISWDHKKDHGNWMMVKNGVVIGIVGRWWF